MIGPDFVAAGVQRPFRQGGDCPVAKFDEPVQSRPLPMSPNHTYLAGVRMGDDDRTRRGDEGGPATGVVTRVKPQTKRPNL